jgi:hypothetical protein
MSGANVDMSGVGPRPKPSPRASAYDNSNIHPDFGSVASATKKLNNWIGDTVAEGDFSDATSRTRAISDTAAQAIKLGAAKASNARTLAKKLLANELKNR